MKTKSQKIEIAEELGWKREYIFGNGVDDYVWVHPTNGIAYPDNISSLPDFPEKYN